MNLHSIIWEGTERFQEALMFLFRSFDNPKPARTQWGPLYSLSILKCVCEAKIELSKKLAMISHFLRTRKPLSPKGIEERSQWGPLDSLSNLICV